MVVCEKFADCMDCNWCFCDTMDNVNEEARDCACLLDLQPVVTGHWIEVPLKKYPEEHNYRCSVCNNLFLFDSNYCPECGAQMKKD